MNNSDNKTLYIVSSRIVSERAKGLFCSDNVEEDICLSPEKFLEFYPYNNDLNKILWKKEREAYTNSPEEIIRQYSEVGIKQNNTKQLYIEEFNDDIGSKWRTFSPLLFPILLNKYKDSIKKHLPNRYILKDYKNIIAIQELPKPCKNEQAWIKVLLDTFYKGTDACNIRFIMHDKDFHTYSEGVQKILSTDEIERLIPEEYRQLKLNIQILLFQHITGNCAYQLLCNSSDKDIENRIDRLFDYSFFMDLLDILEQNKVFFDPGKENIKETFEAIEKKNASNIYIDKIKSIENELSSGNIEEALSIYKKCRISQ